MQVLGWAVGINTSHLSCFSFGSSHHPILTPAANVDDLRDTQWAPHRDAGAAPCSRSFAHASRVLCATPADCARAVKLAQRLQHSHERAHEKNLA